MDRYELMRGFGRVGLSSANPEQHGHPWTAPDLLGISVYWNAGGGQVEAWISATPEDGQMLLEQFGVEPSERAEQHLGWRGQARDRLLLQLLIRE